MVLGVGESLVVVLVEWWILGVEMSSAEVVLGGVILGGGLLGIGDSGAYRGEEEGFLDVIRS